MATPFEGMMGKIAPGLCRLSINGEIAVKTKGGYKTYDVKTGRLINCDSFVFDVGEEFFFLVPTNKVQPGDIILAGGKPRCVKSVGEDTLTVINYEDSTMETLIPERHMFLGNTYFYGRIVSMFGAQGLKGKGGVGKIMKYMMLSEMLKGKDSGSGSMLPMMLMMGSGQDIFANIFDDEDNREDDDYTDGYDDRPEPGYRRRPARRKRSNYRDEQ